jgi:hypothetical protein
MWTACRVIGDDDRASARPRVRRLERTLIMHVAPGATEVPHEFV